MATQKYVAFRLMFSQVHDSHREAIIPHNSLPFHVIRLDPRRESIEETRIRHQDSTQPTHLSIRL